VVTTTPRVPTPAFVDGVNMALVPPGDADALTARLATLHAAPQERETLRAGATQLRKQFLWPGIARDLITFFGQILA
jgi:glycosyltransferase involved in cell wall biosynthesis